MKNSFIFACVLFIMLTNSCTSTKIISSWRAPETDLNINEFNKVLIIALLDNENNRFKVEHEIAKYLNGKGVVSHDYLTDAFNNKYKEQITNKIKIDGFDGIVLIRLIDVDKERAYVPSRRQYNAEDYQGFGDYYLKNNYNYNDSEYYLNTKTYVLKTDIYSLKADKIIWIGITETFELIGIKKMTNKISKVIYKQMNLEGFIKN
jgi:hypothetical protein